MKLSFDNFVGINLDNREDKIGWSGFSSLVGLSIDVKKNALSLARKIEFLNVSTPPGIYLGIYNSLSEGRCFLILSTSGKLYLVKLSNSEVIDTDSIFRPRKG